MPRFVLKRQAGTSSLNGDQVRELPGIRVIDQMDDTAMLVEADAETIKTYQGSLAGWVISEETTYQTPGDRLDPT